MTKELRRCMFAITSVEPCTRAYGDEITGWVYGFYFAALASCRHAGNPGWEIESSRIRRLQLECPKQERVVYLWDRGTVVPATEYGCELSVEFLTTHLASLVYEKDAKSATPTGFIESLRRRFSVLIGR